ncbi:hypothetical protein ABIB25_004119 [Nakamurella sp. UYEF19]
MTFGRLSVLPGTGTRIHEIGATVPTYDIAATQVVADLVAGFPATPPRRT